MILKLFKIFDNNINKLSEELDYGANNLNYKKWKRYLHIAFLFNATIWGCILLVFLAEFIAVALMTLTKYLESLNI